MAPLVARAPGRVNLIGDHTDYQGGLCLPMAIDREVRIEFEPRTDGRAVVTSDRADGVVELPADGAATPTLVDPPWGGTVAAILQVLARLGRAPVGLDAQVTSTVPLGSGLSSSAAFEVAFALACNTVAGFDLEGRDLALAAQEAEQLASGVPCGVMDQMASVFGRAGHALLLDCRTLSIEPVPIPDDAVITVVHSGLPRRLVDSAYAQRRAACEAAAARLGIETLRDATPQQVADDPIARHVVSENARVVTFVDALRADDLAAAGEQMLASHASLRDDFEVSTLELDSARRPRDGARRRRSAIDGSRIRRMHRRTRSGGAPVDRYRAIPLVHRPDGRTVSGACLRRRTVDRNGELMPSIFSRIIAGELPGRFVWKDDRAVAFLSIAPMMPGHTLVVPRDEVDHWIDLDPALAAHLFNVAQQIGRAQQLEWQPQRVGVLIVGEEVPHTHLHVVPINSPNELTFAHVDPSPDPTALDDAADRLRARLKELGRSEVSD